MKALLSAALVVTAALPALAIDKSNQKNVDLFSKAIIAPTAQLKTTYDLKGHTLKGGECTLSVSRTRYGVELDMWDKKVSVLFRVSVSSKTSQQFMVFKNSPKTLGAHQILMTMDERASTASNQSILLTTDGSANIKAISIGNVDTSEWTDDNKPDFSQADPKAQLACVF